MPQCCLPSVSSVPILFLSSSRRGSEVLTMGAGVTHRNRVACTQYLDEKTNIGPLVFVPLYTSSHITRDKL